MIDTKKFSVSELHELTDKIKDSLINAEDSHEIESDDAMLMFNELNQNDAFEQEIEQILSCLNEQTLDLTKLQTQIIILIKKYLDKFNYKKLGLEIDEELISKNVDEVSHYLMHQHSQLVKEANQGLKKPEDNLQSINGKARLDLKRLVNNFAIYQVYKFMNPKRIAGETKEENFAYNMIKGGMKLASHYAGGSKNDLKSYSPQFIKKLENASKNFKNNGRTIH